MAILVRVTQATLAVLARVAFCGACVGVGLACLGRKRRALLWLVARRALRKRPPQRPPPVCAEEDDEDVPAHAKLA
jgi:hypothetical protein